MTRSLTLKDDGPRPATCHVLAYGPAAPLRNESRHDAS